MKVEKLIGRMGFGMLGLLALTACASSPDQTDLLDEHVGTEGAGLEQAQVEIDWIEDLDADQPLNVETATFALG